VQARAQFSLLHGIPKMTKNDPQNEPRELLLGPFWHQNVTELLQNWTPKKQTKNRHQIRFQNGAKMDYTFARESTILGRVWHLGSTWPPETEKLTIFVQKSTPNDQQRARSNPHEGHFRSFLALGPHLDPNWPTELKHMRIWAPKMTKITEH